MLFTRGSQVQDRAPSSRRRIELGTRRFAPRAAAAGGSKGGGVDCRACAAAGDLWVRVSGGQGQEYAGHIGGFSHESEHDLAVMVSDFVENGSGGSQTRITSDSDSGIPDINHLAEKILVFKHRVGQYESDLSSVVHSLLLSLAETDLHLEREGPCNASCIRKPLVKLLRMSGYDAALCISKWQGSGRVPGGEHEYIDVVHGGDVGSERMIIDIDFRSHFEIARAVESYDAILNSLPVIYVGSWAKLKQFLQVMAEAAKSSLKQNSMPLPPWRSLAYLQAKWLSKHERIQSPECLTNGNVISCENAHCFGHLRRLKTSLKSEMEYLKPMNNDDIDNMVNRKLQSEKQRHFLIKL